MKKVFLIMTLMATSTFLLAQEIKHVFIWSDLNGTKAPTIRLEIKSKDDYKIIVNYAEFGSFIMSKAEYEKFYRVLSEIYDKTKEWTDVAKANAVKNVEKKIPIEEYKITSEKRLEFTLKAFFKADADGFTSTRIELRYTAKNGHDSVHLATEMKRTDLEIEELFKPHKSRAPSLIQLKVNELVDSLEKSKKDDELFK